MCDAYLNPDVFFKMPSIQSFNFVTSQLIRFVAPKAKIDFANRDVSNPMSGSSKKRVIC